MTQKDKEGGLFIGSKGGLSFNTFTGKKENYLFPRKNRNLKRKKRGNYPGLSGKKRSHPVPREETFFPRQKAGKGKKKEFTHIIFRRASKGGGKSRSPAFLESEFWGGEGSSIHYVGKKKKKAAPFHFIGRKKSSPLAIGGVG